MTGAEYAEPLTGEANAVEEPHTSTEAEQPDNEGAGGLRRNRSKKPSKSLKNRLTVNTKKIQDSLPKRKAIKSNKKKKESLKKKKESNKKKKESNKKKKESNKKKKESNKKKKPTLKRQSLRNKIKLLEKNFKK